LWTLATVCGRTVEYERSGPSSINLHQCAEVVVMQLVAPVRMVAILEEKPLGEGRR
jgi:hypothetical protein